MAVVRRPVSRHWTVMTVLLPLRKVQYFAASLLEAASATCSTTSTSFGFFEFRILKETCRSPSFKMLVNLALVILSLDRAAVVFDFLDDGRFERYFHRKAFHRIKQPPRSAATVKYA